MRSSHTQQSKLLQFIAYALHRTKLHPSIVYARLGLVLLRLKARFPSAKGSSGHRLSTSAYMIASKVICDDTYSNKSWTIAAQGLFTLREINQMEHEMCSYLDWELNVDSDTIFQTCCKDAFPSATGVIPYISCRNGLQARYQSRYLDICDAYT